MHEKMPAKRENTGLLEDQIEYTKQLLKLVNEDGRFEQLPGISTWERKNSKNYTQRGIK